MKIATGTIFEEYGGVSKHIFNIKEFSSHQVSILPSKLMRIFLNRFRWMKPEQKYDISKQIQKLDDLYASLI